MYRDSPSSSSPAGAAGAEQLHGQKVRIFRFRVLVIAGSAAAAGLHALDSEHMHVPNSPLPLEVHPVAPSSGGSQWALRKIRRNQAVEGAFHWHQRLALPGAAVASFSTLISPSPESFLRRPASPESSAKF